MTTRQPCRRSTRVLRPHRILTGAASRAQLSVSVLGAIFFASSCVAADTSTPDTDAAKITELTRPISAIEIGIGGLHGAPSPAPGSAAGPERPGGFLITNFDLRGSQYSYGNADDDKTRWRVSGSDLGLRSRNLAGEYGRQGAYRILFGHDRLAHLASTSFETPFVNSGATILALPAGFARARDTGGMTSLAAALHRHDLEMRRQRNEIAVSYMLNPDWELRTSWRGEDRNGLRARGAELGSNPGNARTVPLPEPVDSSTQLLDAAIAFTGDAHRFSFGYHGSLFRNRVDAVTWQSPYAGSVWTGGGSGLTDGFALDRGRSGVAPDNQFHQFTANGMVEFSSTTRLTLTGSRGRMTQNEALLPYTINPGLASAALPRGALGGLVNTTFLHARLALRPMRNLSVSAWLRYEDRDNRTPMSEYRYVDGDVQLQPSPGADSERIRTNLPRSRRQQQVATEADYRFSPAAAVRAGWEHDEVRRTFAEVARTTEDTWRIEFRGGSGAFTGSGGVALLARRGTQYLYHLPYLASYTSAAYITGIATENGCIDLPRCIRTGPLQNKFYLADRDRERVRLLLGFMPTAAWSLNARLDINRDRYPHSPYGLTNARSWSAGADLGYIFSDDVSATLFCAVDDQRSRMRSRQISPASATPPGLTDADWANQFADRTASIGAGLRHKGLLGGRLGLSADAIIVRGRTPISTTVGPAVVPGQIPAATLPDLNARSAIASLDARYALDRQTALRANFFYRRLDRADWAFAQVNATTLANVLGTNETTPRLRQYGGGLSWVRSFH